MRTLILFICLWAGAITGIHAQDFILTGCPWACPEEQDGRLNAEGRLLLQEAPVLADAGFSYLWLSTSNSAPSPSLSAFLDALREAGLTPVVELHCRQAEGLEPGLSANLHHLSDRWKKEMGVHNFALFSEVALPAETMTDLLRSWRNDAGEYPRFAVCDEPGHRAPDQAAGWVSDIIEQLGSDDAALVDPRRFDFSLRDALRQACSDPEYDVRRLFEQSMRDATPLPGFNLVTFVNTDAFQNQNDHWGDADDPITDPLPAYAYLLTNNQLGLPAVYLGDYFGGPDHEGRVELRHAIDQLLLIHRKYIFNATALEYLSAEDSPRQAHYLAAAPERSLIFQIDGTNTPAGQIAGGNRDVIVAINFADTTLRVHQEINTANWRKGDTFSDVLHSSGTPILQVADNDSLHVPNAVYLEVPPRSYGVWVQKEKRQVAPSLVSLSVQPVQQFIELTWETPKENAVSGYAIERSVAGRPYEQIHWEEALGRSGEKAAYLFLDEDVYPGELLYYRIKMVKQDGSYLHSPVEKGRLHSPTARFILREGKRPGARLLHIYSPGEEEAELRVFNAEGKAVIKAKPLLRPGPNQAEIDLSTLPAGIYFVNFSTRNQVQWSERIVNY